MFRKKIPVGRIIPPFFFESSESDRVFIYLHDSNSIFRAQGINSEWVSARIVLESMRGSITTEMGKNPESAFEAFKEAFERLVQEHKHTAKTQQAKASRKQNDGEGRTK